MQGILDLKETERHSPETGDEWEVQLRKGCLELAILAALWDAKLYGLEILRRLENDSDLIVSEGTIYPLLSRLKALGLVGSEWVESEAGHPRKYYARTRAGKQRVAGIRRVASLTEIPGALARWRPNHAALQSQL